MATIPSMAVAVRLVTADSCTSHWYSTLQRRRRCSFCLNCCCSSCKLREKKDGKDWRNNNWQTKALITVSKSEHQDESTLNIMSIIKQLFTARLLYDTDWKEKFSNLQRRMNTLITACFNAAHDVHTDVSFKIRFEFLFYNSSVTNHSKCHFVCGLG